MPDRNFTFHPYCAPTAANSYSDDTIESTGAGSKERIELLVQTPAVFDGRFRQGRIFRCITQSGLHAEH
jgi:hypothetical protein